ncbi:uncharacterized protein M421DRAFT_423863 [Didymella exigua CBS 183.55]|uniref:Uncharacterized protein n=1 Tax=Didymella exigua CBS 183.55 TaxID=1150837 RepID=A0A6A5RAQ8_9PLEO|nr:uncharacterized protein M421DRAFT_423863 [Didymella exigua CBS 183.55]KAF1925311.1 hypothetical protein M421DRAFT_423863 [Didymella exigua CBS 183.55]
MYSPGTLFWARRGVRLISFHVGSTAARHCLAAAWNTGVDIRLGLGNDNHTLACGAHNERIGERLKLWVLDWLIRYAG